MKISDRVAGLMNGVELGVDGSRVRVLAAVAAGGAMVFGASVASALPRPLPEPGKIVVRPERKDPLEKVTFANGLRHDFGKIWDHTKVTHRFEFTNDSNVNIAITDAQTSCGCTVSRIEDANGKELPPGRRMFKPGESGAVVAEFDPKRRRGVQIKPIRLFLNGSQTPQYTLEIRANVEQAVAQNPSIVYFRGVEKFGERPTMGFELVGRTRDFDADFVGIEGDGDGFIVEKVSVEPLEEVDGEPRVSVKFRVTVVEGLRQGVFQRRVTFRTTDPRAETLTVPMSAQVLGDLNATPPRLSLGKITPGESIESSFTVVSKTARPFEINEVKLTGPLESAEVAIEPVDPEKRDAYTVTIRDVGGRAARQNGVVSVLTNIPDEPQITLSYYGWVAREALVGGRRRGEGEGEGRGERPRRRDPNAIRARRIDTPARPNDPDANGKDDEEAAREKKATSPR